MAIQFSRTASRQRCLLRYVSEMLEVRRMFSIINWVNEGSVANDSDGFNAVFAGNATQARLIVSRARLDWEEVIVNFNHSNGGNTYSLSINAADLGGDKRAQGGPTSADDDQVPTAGSITLDNDAGGAGWYLDPVVGDDGEFNSLLGPFSATGSITGNDLYRTITHEIGHSMGITAQTITRLSQFLTPFNVDDPVANDATSPGGLMALNVNGGPIEATLTAADPGHFYEGPAIEGRPDIPIHPNDLMNPGRASPDNNRKLISDFDATVLRDVYGYDVNLPSILNSFLANPNFTSDVLTISGEPGNVNDTIVLNSAVGAIVVTVGGYTEIVPTSQVASININSGEGVDLIHLVYNAAKPTNVNGGAGAGDTLYINEGGTLTGTTFTSSLVNTVTYGGLESLVLTGSTGNDVYGVSGTSSYTPVTINAGSGEDSLYINPSNGSLILFSSPITWNGGGSSDKLQFDMQFATKQHQYNVTAASVFVDTLDGSGDVTINMIGFSVIDAVNVNAGSGNDQIIVSDPTVHGTFNGASGNDTFVIGGGNLGLVNNVATLSGGQGTDTLALDDSAYTGAVNWLVDDTGVYRETIGIQSYSYAGFEGVELRTGLGGTRGDWIDINGNLYVNVTVLGGAGPDEFRINYLNNKHSDGFGIVTYLMNVDGGAGFNQLLVNDVSRLATTYSMYADRLEANEALTSDDADFTHANISAMSLTASDSTTTLNVYETPSAIVPGNQTTVLLHDGNDTANIFPHDVNGNLTVTTNIGIVGEAGTDTFNVQDTGSALPIYYSLSNPFGTGTQNIFGMGAGGLGTASIETININAGAGNDIFSVDQYKSGTALNIHGGAGDDTLYLGANNLPANITSVTSFLFDGQADFDRFIINNTTDIGDWTYTRNASTTVAARSGYSFTMSESANEEMTINAGPGGDTFLVPSTVLNNHTVMNGFGGFDTLQTGIGGTVQSLVQGRIDFDGGTPLTALSAGQIIVSAASHGDAKTVHQDATSIGAFPDDNYFAPGGSIHFTNLTNISITGGTANDTFYAQPLQDATVNINGNSPTSAPGDTLNLALAEATGYAVVPGAPGNGSVTSSNLKTLNYGSFETGPTVDAVAPVAEIGNEQLLVSAESPQSPNLISDTIDIVFNEAVIGLDLADFTFTRNEGPNLLTGAQSLTTLDNITWTLMGLSSLTTLTGTYTLTLTAAGSGVSDQFGNAIILDATHEWVVALPPWLSNDSQAVWDSSTNTLSITGSTTIIADPGIDLPTVYADGTAAALSMDPAIDLTIHLGALNLSNGATALLASLGGARTAENHRVLVLNAIYIDNASTLDLADNDMVLDFADPEQNPLSDIESAVRMGYGAGDWLGAGIVSSIARDDSNFQIGIAENGSLPIPFGSSQGGQPFAGVDVDDTCVLVKFTHQTDLNLDGLVSDDDAILISTNYEAGQSSTWSIGDLNHDGVFSDDDGIIFGTFFDVALPQV